MQKIVKWLENRNEEIEVIWLSNNVPKKLINQSFIQHLAWLKFDELANEIWNSVFMEIYPNGAHIEDIHPVLFSTMDEELSQKRIKARSPIKGESLWQVRGIQEDDCIFVYEILSLHGGIKLPFQEIMYTYSSYKKDDHSYNDNFHRKSFKRKKGKKFNRIKHTIENPRRLSQTVISNYRSTIISYKGNKPILISGKERKILLRGGEKYSNNDDIPDRLINNEEMFLNSEGDDRNEEENEMGGLFSTSDIFSDGDSRVKPVDCNGTKVVEYKTPEYMMKFFEMVKCLREMNSSLTVSEPKIMQLPGNRGFSIKINGNPRLYALVEVSSPSNFFYILEIERVRKRYLSTLLIWPRDKVKLEESDLIALLENILTSLVDNNGHWDKNILNSQLQARIDLVKHIYSLPPGEWARLILGIAKVESSLMKARK